MRPLRSRLRKLEEAVRSIPLPPCPACAGRPGVVYVKECLDDDGEPYLHPEPPPRCCRCGKKPFLVIVRCAEPRTRARETAGAYNDDETRDFHDR